MTTRALQLTTLAAASALLVACSAAPEQAWESDPTQLPPIQAAAANVATADDLAAAGYEADAVRQYEQARQRDPSARVAHKLAVLYDRLGRDDRAVAEYRRALAESPSNPGVHNDLGYFFLSRDRAADSERHFRAALDIDPLFDRAVVNLGLALAAQGRIDEAIETMDRVLPPEQSRSNAAMVLAREQKFDQAEALATEAVQLRPDLPQARALLEWLAGDRTRPPADG